MQSIPNCPKCNSEYTYEDMNLFVCPECSHEWTRLDEERKKEEEAVKLEAEIVRDANGTELNDGDDVIVVQDLKVRGSSDSIKRGTKIVNILLKEGSGGHDMECRVPGFGLMELKSEFVRKA